MAKSNDLGRYAPPELAGLTDYLFGSLECERQGQLFALDSDIRFNLSQEDRSLRGMDRPLENNVASILGSIACSIDVPTYDRNHPVKDISPRVVNPNLQREILTLETMMAGQTHTAFAIEQSSDIGDFCIHMPSLAHVKGIVK